MGVAVCQSCGGGESVGSMSLSGGARQASAVGRGAEGRSSKVACVWTRQHLGEKRNANRRGARRGSERNTAQIAADCKLDSSAWWLGCGAPPLLRSPHGEQPSHHAAHLQIFIFPQSSKPRQTVVFVFHRGPVEARDRCETGQESNRCEPVRDWFHDTATPG